MKKATTLILIVSLLFTILPSKGWSSSLLLELIPILTAKSNAIENTPIDTPVDTPVVIPIQERTYYQCWENYLDLSCDSAIANAYQNPIHSLVVTKHAAGSCRNLVPDPVQFIRGINITGPSDLDSNKNHIVDFEQIPIPSINGIPGINICSCLGVMILKGENSQPPLPPSPGADTPF